MSVRRALFILAALTLLLPVIVTVVSANQAASEQGARQASIASLETVVVARGRVDQTVSAPGQIAADEVTDLSFMIPGRVEEVYVMAGDAVQAGDPLVMLDNEAERIAYSAALLSLEIVHLRYDDTAVVDEDEIRIAEAGVQAAWGAYQGVDDRVTDDDIRAAELRYQEAQAALLAAEEARRVASIDSNGLALLDARIGEASFDLEIARLQLEELQTANQGELGAAYANVRRAQQNLEQVLAGASPYELERARVQIEQTLVDLEQAERDFNNTILVAPFDGIVSRLDVERGQVIVTGQPIVQMTDITPLHFEGDIDEVDVSLVEEGFAASVEIDPLDDVRLPGELTDIAPQGESRSGIVNYDIDVSLTEDLPELRPGMTAEAFIIIDSREDVLAVPNTFIRRDRTDSTRGTVSMLNSDGTLREVEVQLGLRGDDVTEVISGLAEGDRIVRDLSGIDNTVDIFGGE